jgi:hypothetical protein
LNIPAIDVFVCCFVAGKKMKQKVPRRGRDGEQGERERERERERYGVVQDFNRGGKKTKEGFFFGK